MKFSRSFTPALFFVTSVCMSNWGHFAAANKPHVPQSCRPSEDTIQCGGHTYLADSSRKCCKLRNSLDEWRYVYWSDCKDDWTVNATETCGNESFNYRLQGCCDQQVFNRTTHKCCVNSTKSTVVTLETTCCDGTPMQSGEMCCQTITSACHTVTPTHSFHDSCCFNLDDDTIETYSGASHFCNPDGHVRKKPSFDSQTPRPCEPGYIPTAGQDCCGGRPYLLSNQTCCENMLFDVSSHDSVCCFDAAFLKTDKSNPCLDTCGSKKREFNAEFQTCCGDRVINAKKKLCCGQEVADRRTHECCGNTAMLKNKMECCKYMTPYNPKVMFCDPVTGGVKAKRQKIADKLCMRKLGRWREHGRGFYDPNMRHIRGRVDGCDVKVTNSAITIQLSFVTVRTRDPQLATCLDGGKLKMKIRKPKQGPCMDEESARHYLRGKILDIYFPKDKQLKNCRGQPRLNVSNNDGVLIIRSTRMDTTLQRLLPCSLLAAGEFCT